MSNAKRIDVWEVETADGGVGVRVGDGPIHMGVCAADVERLLSMLFDGIEWEDSACVGGTLHAVDAALEQAAGPYLTGGEAYSQRCEAIRRQTEQAWE